MGRILFVTGTDTGVGKTLVTASLLFHLRQQGIAALATKPFCSGSRDDVRLLQSIQRRTISDDEANPFYFREPVAPLVAARKTRKVVTEEQVLNAIRHVSSGCDRLIVEGAGGLLSPLGTNFSAIDLISALQCDVCVVAANRLGVINHTLLAVGALQNKGCRQIKVLLTQRKRSPDRSTRTNANVLTELLDRVPVINLPFLGPRASTAASIRRNYSKTAPAWDALLA